MSAVILFHPRCFARHAAEIARSQGGRLGQDACGRPFVLYLPKAGLLPSRFVIAGADPLAEPPAGPMRFAWLIRALRALAARPPSPGRFHSRSVPEASAVSHKHNKRRRETPPKYGPPAYSLARIFGLTREDLDTAPDDCRPFPAVATWRWGITLEEARARLQQNRRSLRATPRIWKVCGYALSQQSPEKDKRRAKRKAKSAAWHERMHAWAKNWFDPGSLTIPGGNGPQFEKQCANCRPRADGSGAEQYSTS